MVGARMENSADCRQLRINAVIMTPAAIVDLLFFLGTQMNHSVIRRLPLSLS